QKPRLTLSHRGTPWEVPMKHKGIEFEIKIRPGNNEWSWTIKPALLAWHSGEVRGSRQFAETAAKLAIERWLRRNRGSRPDAVGEQKPRANRPGLFHMGKSLTTRLQPPS